MPVYTKYNVVTGQAVGNIHTSSGVPVVRLAGFDVVEGFVHPDTHYIIGGVKNERPKMEGVSVSYGEGEVNVTGLPEGASVLFNGVEVDLVPASGVFTYSIAERCTFIFKLWPYQNKVVKVDP